MVGQSWWSNCVVDPQKDREVQEIDELEARISPVEPDILKIRELIGTLEMCHHKAERWLENILEAISAGKTDKGLGSQPVGQVHPVEMISKAACGALSAWVGGASANSVDSEIGDIPASQLLRCLGKRTPLKEWQVSRVIEKIRSWTDFPRSFEDPSTQYIWLVYGTDGCPDQYREHEDFWRETVESTPFGDLKGLDGEPFSLGFAIDMLWTCHWNFVENLQIVLEVIGGTCRQEKPFAACAWNIHLAPVRPRMIVISNTLKAFLGESVPTGEIDPEVLSHLGELTEKKNWLALSLDKTIRLQFNI
jgi:hypothetical protein